MASETPALQPIVPQYHLRILSDEQLADFKSATLEILEEAIEKVRPGGDFLGEPTTRSFMHSEEWLKPGLGSHTSYDGWVKDGRPHVLTEASEKVDQLLANHQPYPLSEEADRELDRIQSRAKMEV